MKKLSLPIIGLLQTLGVAAYCALVAGFMSFAEQNLFAQTENAFFGIFFMLTLLVFSAAVVGLLIFGYAVRLALQQHIKEALAVLGYTLLTTLMVIVLIVIVGAIIF